MVEAPDRQALKPRSGKSASAFRTISEVADTLDLPQHVLRFWESKFPQLKPLKRGGGRRYYRPEDVQLIRHIRGLLYDDGYTIKGVQKILREEHAKPAAEGDDGNGGARAEDLPRAIDGEKRAELEAVLAELEDIRNLL